MRRPSDKGDFHRPSLPSSVNLTMGSPTVLSSPSPPSAPSAFHPPFFRSRRQEMLNPLMAFPLGFSAIFAVHKLGLTLPGETLWRTFSEREQTLWKPLLYVFFWSVELMVSQRWTSADE